MTKTAWIIFMISEYAKYEKCSYVEEGSREVLLREVLLRGGGQSRDAGSSLNLFADGVDFKADADQMIVIQKRTAVKQKRRFLQEERSGLRLNKMPVL